MKADQVDISRRRSAQRSVMFWLSLANARNHQRAGGDVANATTG